jgi:hypothetical protein
VQVKATLWGLLFGCACAIIKAAGERLAKPTVFQLTVRASRVAALLAYFIQANVCAEPALLLRIFSEHDLCHTAN